MKELSIEEKAIRYDEKLDVARHIYADPSVKDEDKYYIEVIFHELAESEDERIRKAIINVFATHKDYEIFFDVSAKDIIAWLEKQGEQNQKHFELKAGHWYICHRAFCCRADHLTVKEGERFMCEKDGIVKGFVIKEPEKYFKEVCAPAPIEDEQKPWSEDAFIEKAAEWLNNFHNEDTHSYLIDEDIEKFINYMKGE